LGLGYKFNGNPVSVYTADGFNLDIGMDAIQGFSLTPEIRYYIQTCENDVPAGFYGSLYSKYTTYNTSAFIEFSPPAGNLELVNADFTLREIGLGFQLGYQLAIKRRFIIDFQFFGPRYSYVTITGKVDKPLSDQFKDEMESYINSIIEKLGADYNFKLKDSGNKTISGKIRLPNIKFGIGLGYSF
jgi:hypothetical protein